MDRVDRCRAGLQVWYNSNRFTSDFLQRCEAVIAAEVRIPCEQGRVAAVTFF